MSYYIDKDLITIDYYRKSSNSEFCDTDMKLYLNYVDAVKNKDDSSIIIRDYHYKTSLKYEKNYLNYIILRANEFYSRCLENENNLNVTERRGK